MQPSVDAALGRVALVIRLIGAVWMVVLATVYGLAGQLERPVVATGVTMLGIAWALVAWWSGWIESASGRDRGLLAVDLGVTSLVLILPAVAGETVGFTGGYPFAALVVGLAALGRVGVWIATGVLSGLTLVALAVVGSEISPFVVGQILLYVFSAVALAMGIEVFRANEKRAREAEAALAVAEERAATATHLHDSVLQTLALVQRRADDAGAVRSLVRRQERELRDWLFPGSSPPSARSGQDAPMDPERPDRGGGAVEHRTLGRALEVQGEEVEERYGIAVRVVTVGGAGSLVLHTTDERSGLAALVLAAREAMTNAAVHAGVPGVDVFAETAADGAVVVFVRDRGTGFELATMPGDRQGVRGSILGRMERVGGQAVVRSTPGRGTEVELRLTPGGTRT